VFPSEYTRSIFFDYVTTLLNSAHDDTGLREMKEGSKVVKYEFEMDENGDHVVLGRGSFGCVYSALDLDTKKLVCTRDVITMADLSTYVDCCQGSAVSRQQKRVCASRGDQHAQTMEAPAYCAVSRLRGRRVRAAHLSRASTWLF
jgi:hypothetical protein